MLKSIFWGPFSCFLGPVCSPGTPASMLGTGVPLRDRAGWVSPMFSHTEGRFAAPTPRTGLCRGVWDLFSLFFFFPPSRAAGRRKQFKCRCCEQCRRGCC